MSTPTQTFTDEQFEAFLSALDALPPDERSKIVIHQRSGEPPFLQPTYSVSQGMQTVDLNYSQAQQFQAWMDKAYPPVKHDDKRDTQYAEFAESIMRACQGYDKEGCKLIIARSVYDLMCENILAEIQSVYAQLRYKR